MKKLINIALFFMGCLCLTSCGEDNTEIEAHGLEVLATSRTDFGPMGGTNSIAVASQAVKAYAKADWLSVSTSEKGILVTASENNALTSRHSTVVIKSSELDSTIVSVSQAGKVLKVSDMPRRLNVENKDTTLSYSVNANSPVQVTSDATWAKPTCVNGKISVEVEKNESGHLRSCYVKYSNGLVEDSVGIVQYNLKENILGKYILQGINAQGTAHETVTFNCELVQSGSNYSLKVNAYEGLTIPVTFEPTYPYLQINAGSWVGEYYGSHLALFMVDEDGYLTHSNSYFLAGLFDYSSKIKEKDANLEGTGMEFVGSAGYPYFILRSYMEKEYTSDYDEGNVLILANVGLFRLSNQSDHE